MFNKVLDIIYKKSPLQKKMLSTFVDSRDLLFWNRADTFVDNLEQYLETSGLNLDDAVNAYLKMCKNTLVEQTKFLRSGLYSCSNQDQAFVNIYSNDLEMRSYMLGLALSQFLWKNHYAIYNFFLETLTKYKGKVLDYLEIGPGHGLFFAAALNQLQAQNYTGLDISSISIDICRGILPFLSDFSDSSVVLNELNALEIDNSQKYDFITMGEVIEHLDEPRPLLRKISEMLQPLGCAFLTTCANCPAIDHVYLFRNVQEIRDLLNECGLVIEDELALGVDTINDKCIADNNLNTINYAAVVKSVK